MPKHRGVPRYFTRKRERSGAVTLWWQPSTELRREGFKSERLPADRGSAYRRCDELNDRVDRWRRDEVEAPAAAVRHAAGTFSWLCERFRESREFRSKRAITRFDYEKQMRLLSGTFGPELVRHIDRSIVYTYRQGLNPGRQSHYRMQVLRIVLEHGRNIGLIEGENPASRPGGFGLKARTTLWSDEQIAAFKAKAPASLQLALDLALYTGQRQGDLLRLQWANLRAGWIELTQSKTSAAVSIPIHRELKAALGPTDRVGLVLVNETTGQPWRAHAFRQRWAAISEEAGIEGVLFMDLRRTSVTRLGEAGCTVPEIASITGHSVDDVQRILDTYLRPTRKMAAKAIRKLERSGSGNSAARGRAAEKTKS